MRLLENAGLFLTAQVSQLIFKIAFTWR